MTTEDWRHEVVQVRYRKVRATLIEINAVAIRKSLLDDVHCFADHHEALVRNGDFYSLRGQQRRRQKLQKPTLTCAGFTQRGELDLLGLGRPHKAQKILCFLACEIGRGQDEDRLLDIKQRGASVPGFIKMDYWWHGGLAGL